MKKYSDFPCSRVKQLNSCEQCFNFGSNLTWFWINSSSTPDFQWAKSPQTPKSLKIWSNPPKSPFSPGKSHFFWLRSPFFLPRNIRSSGSKVLAVDSSSFQLPSRWLIFPLGGSPHVRKDSYAKNMCKLCDF